MRERILSRFVMPAAAKLTPLKSWEHLERMCEDEWRTLARQRSAQLEAVRSAIAHAYDETELARDALDRVGMKPDDVRDHEALARVPITSKSDLRAGFPDRQIARSYRRGWLRFSNTSGTTGKPLVLAQDTQDIAWKYASILRSRRLAQVDPMGRQSRITPNECQPCLPDGERASPLVQISLGADAAMRRAAAFSFLERQVVHPLFHRRDMLPPFWPGGGPITPVDYARYVEPLRDDAPHVLTLYPLYALLIARWLTRTGTRPPTISGAIDLSGGLTTPSMRAVIESGFAHRTAQGCGGCEFARYGASCTSDRDRLHLAESYACAEIVRSDDTPCASGEIGNVIVTSLHARAMPMIRLEPGDVGRVIEEPCDCGRTSRRLEHHGRVQSVLRNAEGRYVTDRECQEALLCVPGVSLFRLQQEKEDRYTLAIVKEDGARLDEAANTHALETLLGTKAIVARAIVDGIVPEASGKLQLVKSSTYAAFRPASARAREVPIN
jgi:phenylacetate-CoA ligase